MNPTVLPWSILIIFLTILVLLSLRELVIVFRFQKFHPERKIARINFLFLFVVTLLGFIYMHLLVKHDAVLALLIQRYPNARYAPEREQLSKTDEWVYVTKDSPEEVMQFYVSGAGSHDKKVVLSDATDGRLVVLGNSKNLFLTVVVENKLTILHYSLNGEIKHK